ncbi:trichohyalin-like [Ostrea edulis]|uniref:trichohyalin-like n=1 Tax=Ostrea edulis TaxID=37623 RepID=UPI0024AF51B1|nr:trichohyalin-like [Ostrea edulis]
MAKSVGRDEGKRKERKKINYKELIENDENSREKPCGQKLKELAKSKEAMRAKLYRLGLTNEKKERLNQLAKERMRKYRAKLKENTKKPTNVPTRKEEVSQGQRAYWRGKKRQSRTRETQDGKLRERKKINFIEKDENSLEKPHGQKLKKLAKSKEAMRAKLYRLGLADEKRERSNQLAKERMRKYREKLKENNDKKPTNVSKCKLKEAKEEVSQGQRAYWREKKRQSRTRETQEKKQLYNLKRREKYKETKVKKSLSKNKSANSSEQNASFTEDKVCDEEAQKPRNENNKSPATTRKTVARCSGKLPRTPKKWLKVVGGLIKPRKKKLLDESGLVASPKTKPLIEAKRELVLGVKDFIKKHKSRRNKYQRKNWISAILNDAKKQGIQIFIKQNPGIQWRNLVKKSFIQREVDNS